MVHALIALGGCFIFSSNGNGTSTDQVSGVDSDDGTDAPVEGAPTVEITSPKNGEHFRASRIDILAEAADDVGVVGVQFFANGASIGTDEVAPFEIEWDAGDFEEGEFTIRALATDTEGHTATDEIVLIADRTAPAMRFDSPANGGIVGGTVKVQLSVTDDGEVDNVELYNPLDGDWVGLEEPYSVDLDTTELDKQEYTLWARASDKAGNEAETYISVSVDQPPLVTITTHADGSTFAAPTTVDVSVSDDGAIERVEYGVNGTAVHTAYANPYDEWYWDVESCVATGAFTLSATAFDDVGNSTTASVGLTSTNTAPTVSITQPSDGASIDGTDEVKAQISDDNGIVSVQWFVDGTLLLDGAGSSLPTFYAYIDWFGCYISDGAHTLKIVVTDGCGETAEDSVNFTMSNYDACCDTGDLDPEC